MRQPIPIRRTRVRAALGRVLAGTAAAVAVAASLTATAVPASAAAALTVTNPSLVFTPGSTAITLSSDQPSVTWSVTDDQGGSVGSGTTTIDHGAGTINLNRLGPGYYALSVAAGSGTDATTRSTSFAVLTPLPAGPRDQRFGVAIHVHAEYDDNWLDDAGKVGFGAVRTDVSWNTVEATPGVYTYPAGEDAGIAHLHQLGMTMLLIADYSNQYYDGGKTPSSPAGLQAFARFASNVLTHYGTKGNQLEVYNEFNGSWFNNGACGTTADCYLPMLEAVYTQVKADHPGATVVGPALFGVSTSWLGRLFSLGGLNYLDAVTVHDYIYPNEPESSIGTDISGGRNAIDAAGGSRIPLWLDENGWPTTQGSTTEAAQADYLIRTEALTFGNGGSRYFDYDLINGGTDPTNREDNFGMFRRPDTGVTALAPKPAAVAQAVAIRQLNHLPYTGRDDIGSTAYSYRFGSGGATKRVLWTQDGTTQTVELATTRPVTVTDEYGESTVHRPSGGRVELTLTQHPVFVAGAVTGVAADSE